MGNNKKAAFYAVRHGRAPGIYKTWEECEVQIKGYPGAIFKKFANATDAESFVNPVPSRISSSNTTAPPDVKSEQESTKENKRRLAPNVDDESDWDVVYSDGACKGNGQVGSVAGIGVWWGPDDSRNIAERCPGDQTNNRAELIAIIRVLETTPRTKKPLLIKTDSQYSIQCFEKWLPNWVRNNFRSSKGEPVKNASVIRYLSAHLDARAMKGQKVRLQYVKGHSGETGNDGADALANLGTHLPAVEERDWEKLEKDLEKGDSSGSLTSPTGVEIIGPKDAGLDDEVAQQPVKRMKISHFIDDDDWVNDLNG